MQYGCGDFFAGFYIKRSLFLQLKDPFLNNEDSRFVAVRCDTLNLFCKSCRVPQPCIFDIISISSIIHEDKPLIYRQVRTDQVSRDTGFYKVHLQNSASNSKDKHTTYIKLLLCAWKEDKYMKPCKDSGKKNPDTTVTVVALNSTELKACHAFRAYHKLRITCLWMCVGRLCWHECPCVCYVREHTCTRIQTPRCVRACVAVLLWLMRSSWIGLPGDLY